MRYYIDNKPEVVLDGMTVDEVLQNAVTQYPALKFHLFDSKGKIRRHINIFVNNQNVRELDGLETKLKEDDRVTLLTSISGG